MLAEAVRLNLGSGDTRLEGFVNLDLRDDVADVVAPADCLPYGSGTVEEIVALDLLEHFPASRTQDVLREWKRVLVPSGRLTIKVPNMVALSEAIVNDVLPPLMIRNIYGGHRWGPDGAWDAHHTGWTPQMISEELAKAGFDFVSNDEQLNMTVVAEKR